MILSIFQILKQNIHSFGYQNSTPAKIEICQTSVDGFDDIFRICDQLGVELTDDHVVELHLDGRLDYEDFEVTGRLFKLELMLETKEGFRQRLEDELKLKFLRVTGEEYA